MSSGVSYWYKITSQKIHCMFEQKKLLMFDVKNSNHQKSTKTQSSPSLCEAL